MPMVGFPLLLIPLAIYNIIVFLMPGVSFTDPLVRLTLMSGAIWTVTLSDVLLTLAILLLLSEVVKGARPGAKYLTDHLLSLIVFSAAAAEFVLWKEFGTSTFFLLTALALVDFLSGLALRTRRRPVATAAPLPAGQGQGKAGLPAAEPPFAPAAPLTASSSPTTSVPEPWPQGHPEPQSADPVTTPHAASAEVASPRLQPGSASPPSPDTPQR